VWAEGAYVRAFDGPGGRAAWRVTQVPSAPGRARLAPVTLEVEVDAPRGPADPWSRLLRRMLGVDVSLAPFFARAREVPELAPLARLALGLRPPRFASLHEAFASVILFQQVSLASGVATLRRLVAALSRPVATAHGPLLPFPEAAAIASAPDAVLRRAGLSGAKARSLRAAAAAIAAGALRDEDLDRCPPGARRTPAGPGRRRAVDRVAPRAARYFGRLDVFPPGDVAAEKALGIVGGAALVRAARALARDALLPPVRAPHGARGRGAVVAEQSSSRRSRRSRPETHVLRRRGRARRSSRSRRRARRRGGEERAEGEIPMEAAATCRGT
jgi:DNA-3-methyladenine glycosylase II